MLNLNISNHAPRNNFLVFPCSSVTTGLKCSAKDLIWKHVNLVQSLAGDWGWMPSTHGSMNERNRKDPSSAPSQWRRARPARRSTGVTSPLPGTCDVTSIHAIGSKGERERAYLSYRKMGLSLTFFTLYLFVMFRETSAPALWRSFPPNPTLPQLLKVKKHFLSYRAPHAGTR